MSLKSQLQERFGARVLVRDADKVSSGSAAVVAICAEPNMVNAPGLALALIKRHVPSRSAKRFSESVFDAGFAVVRLPKLEDFASFADDVQGCGATTAPYHAPDRIDVRAVRETMNLSQDQFALEFGLDVASVRNWEQSRSQPDAATRVLLRTISVNPDAVRSALMDRPELVASPPGRDSRPAKALGPSRISAAESRHRE